MHTASLHELKKELSTLDKDHVQQLCLRLAKYKIENKELLSYLLFHSANEEAFISEVKDTVDEQLASMNSTNLYWAKKTVRKALKTVNKFVRYSGKKETELELRLHFCRALKETGIPFRQSTALTNLYEGQLKRMEKAMTALHEDLQYDYRLLLNEL